MIRFEDVSKVYEGGTEAVQNISFTIPTGELMTLVGPSGCGKTTSLKMVNRLIEPTEGMIHIGDEPLAELDPIQHRRNVGYVIQEIGLFDHMSVGQNIGIVPRISGWDEDRIEQRVTEMLELVRLPPEIKENDPTALSGGQRQRVGVARALAAHPDILLMDEPFGALDPITREELQDEFLEIQTEVDATIVFVTHDIDEALKMGDRVAVMRNGELVQSASPRELLADPANQFVETFIGEDRVLKQLETVAVQEVMQDEQDTESGATTVDANDDLKSALQTLLMASHSRLAVMEGDEEVGTITKDDIDQEFADAVNEFEEVNHA
jgi:osmoprotectant transport system ATP-binding protein